MLHAEPDPDLSALSLFVTWEAYLLIGAFVVAVAHSMVVGAVNLQGLLRVKDDGGEISPARIQLMLFSVGYGLYYLMQAISSKAGVFPPIPDEMLYVLGGSHGLYLGSKAFPKLINSLTQS